MATPNPKKARPRRRNRMRNDMVPAADRLRSRSRDANPSTTDTPSWQAAKLLGGAVGSSLALAYIARQDWIPPKALTGAVTAGGVALLLGSENPTLKMLGGGAAAAAGGQFTYLLVDDELKVPSQPAPKPPQAAGTHPSPPVKTNSNADSLPPGALEAAYERARRRMALTPQADSMQ